MNPKPTPTWIESQPWRWPALLTYAAWGTEPPVRRGSQQDVLEGLRRLLGTAKASEEGGRDE